MYATIKELSMIKWNNYQPSKLTTWIGLLSILWIVIESFILNSLPEQFVGGDALCTILTNLSYSLFAGIVIYYLSIDVPNNIRSSTFRNSFNKRMYRSIRSYKRVINSIDPAIKLIGITKDDFINEVIKHPFRRIGGLMQTTPSGGIEVLGFPEQLVRHKNSLLNDINTLMDALFYLDANTYASINQLVSHKLWDYIDDHNNFINMNSIPKGAKKSDVNIGRYQAEMLYDILVIYNDIYKNTIEWDDIPTAQFFQS